MRFAPETTDTGKRLDLFLQERLPEYSRSRLQAWIREGRVQVDGNTARPALLLKAGMSIEVTPAAPPPLHAEPEDIPITVVYADEDVAVIDKPAGMVVHAGAGHRHGTLVNALLAHFGKLSTGGDPLRPGIVHRLDRDTSGLIVVARSDQAHRALAEQFQRRSVDKVYLALVQGRLAGSSGRFTDLIRRDPVRRTRMTTGAGSGARTAVTEYQVLRELPGPLSYLRVKILTGRTHQIRVHLARHGHPLVGDTLYGAPREPSLGRFFLHAAELAFTSPSSGERLHLESALPPELADYLRQASDL